MQIADALEPAANDRIIVSLSVDGPAEPVRIDQPCHSDDTHLRNVAGRDFRRIWLLLWTREMFMIWTELSSWRQLLCKNDWYIYMRRVVFLLVVNNTLLSL